MSKKAIVWSLEFVAKLAFFAFLLVLTISFVVTLLAAEPDHHATVQSFKYLTNQIEQLEKHPTKTAIIVPYYMAEHKVEDGKEIIPYYSLNSKFGHCKENELCLCKDAKCHRFVKGGRIKKKYRFRVNVPPEYFRGPKDYNIVKNVEIRKIPREGTITEIQINKVVEKPAPPAALVS